MAMPPRWRSHSTSTIAASTPATTAAAAGGTCTARTDSSHAAVPNKARPSPALTQTIQRPGRGSSRARPGTAAISR